MVQFCKKFFVYFCLLVVFFGYGCGSKDVDLPDEPGPADNSDVEYAQLPDDSTDDSTPAEKQSYDEEVPMPEFLPGKRETDWFFLDSFDIDVNSGDGTEKTQIECKLLIPEGSPPYPVILVAHGWPGNGQQMLALAKYFQKNGYAALAWSARGYGGSTELARLNSPEYEVKDVIRIINWLGAQEIVIREDGSGKEFANGRLVDFDFNNDGIQEPDDIPGDETNDFVLGIAGASYGGAIQLLTAAFDRRVDAIAPWITWHDLYQSLGPNGSLKLLWTELLYAGGQLISGFTVDPILTEWITGIVADNDLNIDGLESGLLQRSPKTYLDKIQIPTYIIQGENDTMFDINQGVANFEGLRGYIDDIKMYWNTAGHSGLDITGLNTGDTNILSKIRDWYDRYLKDDDTIDIGPEFEYDIKKEDGWVIESGKWPVVEEDTEYELIGFSRNDAGMLQLADNQDTSNETPTSYNTLKNIPYIKIKSDINTATFETTEFSTGTEITGIPRIRIYLSTNSEDITFFFELYHVYPSGYYEVIDFDVTPFRLLLDEEDIASDTSEVLDKAKPYDIDLRGFAHYFPEGHKLRLTIATCKVGYMHSRVKGEGYICHDGDHMSTLYLPIVPSEK